MSTAEPGRWSRFYARAVIFLPLLPSAIAVCFMVIAFRQQAHIRHLRELLGSVKSEESSLSRRNPLTGFRLFSLQSEGTAYLAAKVAVAWNPQTSQGFISTEDLPEPPAGYEYHLWVLDPKGTAPVSAGRLDPGTVSREFSTGALATDVPGFALSVDPAGNPTTPGGPLIFTVSPAEP